jgi:hypothetical protein
MFFFSNKSKPALGQTQFFLKKKHSLDSEVKMTSDHSLPSSVDVKN